MDSEINQFKQERKKIIQFKDLSGAEKNDLPDLCFAIILPGGKKDESGKTIPRSLRKLPYKTADGKLDPSHVRNAWAVLSGARGGVDLSPSQKAIAMRKIKAAMRALGIGDEKMSDSLESQELITFSQIFDEERLYSNTESQIIPQPNHSINEILNLNEKMIVTLERADQQIQALSQLNAKLVNDVQTKENELNAYKQVEIQSKKNQYEQKLNDIHTKWCETFSLKDISQQEDAKKMLSSFDTIDKLETIKGFLENKMTQMSNMPQPITRQSEELIQLKVEKSIKPWDLETMSVDEKKAYTESIYEKMKKTKK